MRIVLRKMALFFSFSMHYDTPVNLRCGTFVHLWSITISHLLSSQPSLHYEYGPYQGTPASALVSRLGRPWYRLVSHPSCCLALRTDVFGCTKARAT